ncbi:sugar ABC transporter permease [Cognatishimia sp. WU-CL00825]|uniref:carbohydrate ABC transporter permease n=1 Tax=Cognatishimia sp. WU-CL00825 TaxID=3127658 RepID=UPI0033658615
MTSVTKHSQRPATAGRTLRGRFHLSERTREAFTGYLLILPLFFGVTILFFYPIARSFELSFMKTGIFSGETFVGLDQYKRLFNDPQMWVATRNTFLYAAVALLEIPLAVFFATLLHSKNLRFLSGYRVLFFLPVVTLPSAIGMIWALMYNGDFGIVNHITGVFGAPKISWLTTPYVVIIAVAFVGIWMGLGRSIILVLAGLQTVPKELHEAAEIDGAGPVRQFFDVTLPMISPTVFLVAVLNVIASMQVFDLIFIMINPDTNPIYRDAQTLVVYFYEIGFIDSNRGFAAAISIILLVIIMAITGLQFWLQRRWVNYDR